jgi:hypothetical protein
MSISQKKVTPLSRVNPACELAVKVGLVDSAIDAERKSLGLFYWAKVSN